MYCSRPSSRFERFAIYRSAPSQIRIAMWCPTSLPARRVSMYLPARSQAQKLTVCRSFPGFNSFDRGLRSVSAIGVHQQEESTAAVMTVSVINGKRSLALTEPIPYLHCSKRTSLATFVCPPWVIVALVAGSECRNKYKKSKSRPHSNTFSRCSTSGLEK